MSQELDIEKCYEHSCKERDKRKFYGHIDIDNQIKKPLPPDRAEIGRAAWLVLHTIAANYPNHPTEEEKRKQVDFFLSFSNLYPCHICKIGLLHILKTYKVNCESKIEYSKYIFNLHNMINEELGKEYYSCKDITEIIDKYKTNSEGEK